MDGASQLGLFRTGLIASPGCGGPAFAVELFKRLSRDAPCSPNAVEMQVHVCLVIGYMTAHDSKWRHDFMESGAVEAVLAAMEFLHKQNRESIVTSFGLMCDGVEVGLDARIDTGDLDESLNASSGNINGVFRDEISFTEPDESRGFTEYLEARLQCAASWALAGLVKDSVASTSHFTLNVIQVHNRLFYLPISECSNGVKMICQTVLLSYLTPCPQFEYLFLMLRAYRLPGTCCCTFKIWRYDQIQTPECESGEGTCRSVYSSKIGASKIGSVQVKVFMPGPTLACSSPSKVMVLTYMGVHTRYPKPGALVVVYSISLLTSPQI